MRYVNMIEDKSGDLVELDIYCSADCFRAGTGQDPYGHAWPCPEAAGYDQHCPHCERVVVAAIGTPAFDGWPDGWDAAPDTRDVRPDGPAFA